jgi:hypothetical protein
MLGRIFRVVIGFALASLAAGLTLVLFVYTPVELAGAAGTAAGARFAEAGLLALAAATQVAIFSAPFALIAVLAAAGRRRNSAAYFALAGIAIAGVGFWAQYRGEAAGELSILNTYALSAFALTGLVGGLVFWLCAAERSDGGRRPVSVPAPLAAATASPEGSASAAAELPKT